MSGTSAFLAVALLAARPEAAAVPEGHPLVPVIRIAETQLAWLDRNVRDCTFTMVKRERIDGRLGDFDHIYVKLRPPQVRGGRVVEPMAVYLRYLGPEEVEGREVIYVEGRYDGKLIARNGGKRFAYVTRAVDPQSELAMRRTRYSITEIGLGSMMEELIAVARSDLEHGECRVDYFEGAKIDGRPATLIQVTHPQRREHFRYHVARVFIDDELRLPVRYASYGWPDEPGGRSPLIEEFTYLGLQFNVGLSDRDFDPRNEAYEFGGEFGR